MRFSLPSGTECEIDRSAAKASLGLVIAPDIFGLRPLYDDLVARLATQWNMVVCAVEPFPGMNLGPEVEPRFAAVKSLDDEKYQNDLVQAADSLNTDEVGLIGFCMGGMYCFKAARSDRFTKIVSFYGMIKIPSGWQSPTQGEPLDYLRSGNADRVMAIIGAKDSYTPPNDVAELGNVGVRVEVFPLAEHGFAHDPSRPAHRVDDAKTAFGLAKNWFTN